MKSDRTKNLVDDPGLAHQAIRSALGLLPSPRRISKEGCSKPCLLPSAYPARTSAMGGYPWQRFVLFELLHSIVLYPTRQPLYQLVVLAAMLAVAVQLYRTVEVTEPLRVGYGVGFHVGLHFGFIAYVLYIKGSFPDH